MNDVTVWQGIVAEHLDAVAEEIGYSVDAALLTMPYSAIPAGERQAVRDFEAALLGRLHAELCENIERLRRILSAVAERQGRRALEWLHLTDYAQVEQAGRALIPIQDNSTGRQISSFWGNHLPELDAAGVDPMLVGDVLAREDKFITTASRAIARIEHADLSTADKQAAIREIVEDAATMPSAAELGRKWLNGAVTIPRDILTMLDGITRLVTFVCRTDDEFLTLDKRTRGIVGEYGNVEPVLIEWMKGQSK